MEEPALAVVPDGEEDASIEARLTRLETANHRHRWHRKPGKPSRIKRLASRLPRSSAKSSQPKVAAGVAAVVVFWAFGVLLAEPLRNAELKFLDSIGVQPRGGWVGFNTVTTTIVIMAFGAYFALKVYRYILERFTKPTPSEEEAG